MKSSSTKKLKYLQRYLVLTVAPIQSAITQSQATTARVILNLRVKVSLERMWTISNQIFTSLNRCPILRLHGLESLGGVSGHQRVLYWRVCAVQPRLRAHLPHNRALLQHGRRLHLRGVRHRGPGGDSTEAENVEENKPFNLFSNSQHYSHG